MLLNVLLSLLHCINKNILVFSKDPFYPVKVYSANHFDKDRAIETETPVILAHDSENPHYESLLPKGKTDIPKCIELVKSIQNNTYDKSNAMDYWKKAQNAKKRDAERQRYAKVRMKKQKHASRNVREHKIRQTNPTPDKRTRKEVDYRKSTESDETNYLGRDRD